MIARSVELLALLGLGAFWGWYSNSLAWLGGGSLAAVLFWLHLEDRRFKKLRVWLQDASLVGTPKLPHVWGELVVGVGALHRGWVKEAQQNQARLDEFLSAIQSSPNGVMLLDGFGRIEWSNQTVADQLGIDPQHDLLQHVSSLVRDPDFHAYLHAGDFKHEVTINSPLSTPSKPLLVAVRIHRYGENRRLMLSRDVTAVQQVEAMRRDFVANVSHEIRTPLTVLSGFVETLQTLTLPLAERQKYLALMETQASRMQTLVNDLLVLSKLEGSPAPTRKTCVQVDALIEICMQEAKGLSLVVADGGHVFSVTVPVGFSVAGSATELESAISNLLHNAVRYTPPGGKIDIGARLLASGDAELWVSDTGPGIAPEHVPRLTERFYRVDRSRSRDTGGTGLGLAIVKHIAQRHGGHLRVESKLGKGSTFTVLVPSHRVSISEQPL